MRFIYFIFFFFSFLLILPVNSFAAVIPIGVYQAASVSGSAVATGSVSSILPASALAGVPSVGTAAAAGSSATVSVGVAVPVVVSGVALAGGYYIGGQLAIDAYDIYNSIKDAASDYPAMHAALVQAAEADGPFDPINPPVGSVISGQSDDTTFANYITASTFTPAAPWGGSSSGIAQKISWPAMKGMKVYNTRLYYVQWVRDYDATRFVFQYWSAYTSGTTTAPPSAALPLPPPAGMVSPDQAVENMTNPDGTLKPEIEAEIKAGLASGAIGGSNNPTMAGTTTGITPELLQLYGRLLAAQNATDVNATNVEALQNAVNVNPTDLALQNQLAEAQARLAEAQAAQAAQEAALAAETAAAEAATANLGPPNTYDSSIDIPVKKEIPSLLNSVFDNSPLLGLVRSFHINTSDQQAVFNIGHFYGQDLVFDFSRWASVLAACGTILLVLSHAYAVFIVVKGG